MFPHVGPDGRTRRREGREPVRLLEVARATAAGAEEAPEHSRAAARTRWTCRDEFGVESRRAGALVLVGHPGGHPDVPENEVDEALRTFSPHVTRVEVLTCKELPDNAERSLAADIESA
ncbi:hypothetical protein OG350_29710 [Streptomyces achromogenes]|uniref:Uncharacterized protein n=1 Tax=Streptomyces achromogenes TaxID=67255 RepID=A0ABZ1KWY2_STRAH